jgi:alpha-N-arabinofuranosidase
MVRVGDDYYLVTSSFAYFPGLPIFHSTDLVSWKQIGHALTRRSQLRLENGQGISRGIFAPTLRFHDGLFYLITTDVDGIGNFYITAEDPAGPWSDPVLLPEIQGIDPDLFFDDDGRVYIAHNGEPEGQALYQGHRAIWLWEYDLANRRVLKDSGRVIVNGGVDLTKQPIWIEAPHIFRYQGWYYLSCAEGGTADQHSQVIFRTRELDEPFVPYDKNPILTQRDLDPDRPNPITSTGHADMVQTVEGDWWAVFLGIRPYDREYHNTGRETFLLPVRWQDGWPVILDAGTEVPYRVPRPSTGASDPSAPPQSGNFTWRDEFDAPELKPDWSRIRTSEREWFSIDAGAGVLELEALPVSLQEKTQPAYLGRVQQHLEFVASTRMELPRTDGVTAGLVAFQSSDFHYFLGVHRSAGSYEIFLREVRAGSEKVVARASFTSSDPWIVLGLDQEKAQLSFFYQLSSSESQVLISGVDARLLSTQVAGGFVGTTLGLHASSE